MESFFSSVWEPLESPLWAGCWDPCCWSLFPPPQATRDSVIMVISRTQRSLFKVLFIVFPLFQDSLKLKAAINTLRASSFSPPHFADSERSYAPELKLPLPLYRHYEQPSKNSRVAVHLIIPIIGGCPPVVNMLFSCFFLS